MNKTVIEERVVYQKTARTTEEVTGLLDGLDLGPIKFKLMDAEEGEGWNRGKVEEMEKQYKRFLLLTVTSGHAIIPTKEIDAFWHQHILDTQKYADDCERCFGFFLHHFPYIGLRGEDDRQNLEALFQQTRQIYEAMFGESYGVSAQDCENCGNCSASCGVGDCDTPQRVRPTVEPLAVC